MAATFRAKTEGAEGEATTYALKTPSSMVIGDLVLFDMFVTTESAVTIPGLTIVQVKFSGFSYVVGYGLATGAGEQTYTAAWGGVKQFRQGGILVYKEPNATTPVPAKASEAGAVSKTITWPSITPGVENCLDVLIAIQGGVKTGASGYTQRSNRSLEYVADKALTSGGATGTITAEMTTSEAPVVFRFAVAPIEEVAPSSSNLSMVI